MFGKVEIIIPQFLFVIAVALMIFGVLGLTLLYRMIHHINEIKAL